MCLKKIGLNATKKSQICLKKYAIKCRMICFIKRVLIMYSLNEGVYAFGNTYMICTVYTTLYWNGMLIYTDR